MSMPQMNSGNALGAGNGTNLREIVETTIRHRSNDGKKYYGGAIDRILAQISKDVNDPETLINELEAAFQREERFYT